MSTEDIVEKFLAEQRSVARDQGFAEAVITLYEARFGAPPANVVALIKQTHDGAVLRDWIKLVGTASADEVAATLHSKLS